MFAATRNSQPTIHTNITTPTPLLTLCAVSKDQDQSTSYAARDALSRRWNPEVAAKVYAALTDYHKEQLGFADQIISPRKLKDEYLAKAAGVQSILNLLDGKTT